MQQRQRGFTLVEMAIVLFIIGIILAGVMKATDIYHSAQMDNTISTFIQPWKQAIYDYYEITGDYLGDGLGGGAPDGLMDGSLTAPGVDPETNADYVEIHDNLIGTGINICDIIHTSLSNGAGSTAVCDASNKDIFTRMVSGEFTGKVPVHVGFYPCEITVNGIDVPRNCLVVYGAPIDLAIRYDARVDGTAVGTDGNVRLLDTPVGAAPPNPILVGNYIDYDNAALAGNQDLPVNFVEVLEF